MQKSKAKLCAKVLLVLFFQEKNGLSGFRFYETGVLPAHFPHLCFFEIIAIIRGAAVISYNTDRRSAYRKETRSYVH